MNHFDDAAPPAEAAPAVAAPATVRPDSQFTLIEIPAGTLVMGTSNAQIEYLLAREEWAEEWDERRLFQTEQPQHNVAVPAFCISARPVTNTDYRTFIWATGHRPPRHWIGFEPPADLEDHPVVAVAYADVTAYCQWLAQATGLPYRLPTEIEWERAARGNDDRISPWGTDFDPWRCNTAESAKGGTTPVGWFSPGGDSPFGVTDMAGNVWEWTSSVLRTYPVDQPDEGRQRGAPHYVVRGGAWYYTRKLARCASREGLLPTYTSPALGFRLALSR